MLRRLLIEGILGLNDTWGRCQLLCLSLVDRSETFYCSIKIESCDMGIFASSLDWQKLGLQSGIVCRHIHSFLWHGFSLGSTSLGNLPPGTRAAEWGGAPGSLGQLGRTVEASRFPLQEFRCSPLLGRWTHLGSSWRPSCSSGKLLASWVTLHGSLPLQASSSGYHDLWHWRRWRGQMQGVPPSGLCSSCPLSWPSGPSSTYLYHA